MKKFTILLISTLSSLATTAISQTQDKIESTLVILDIHSGKETIILKENRHFEAPNWSRDGKFLIINSNGKLEKISTEWQKTGRNPHRLCRPLQQRPWPEF
ncbi:MAG: hypothetical protein U5K51_08045 [Flavobacteriaceae bacterium]|nr:hypothetical protein [Flavobacteriaceae bacterium]